MSYVSYTNIDSNNTIKSLSHILTLVFFCIEFFFSFSYIKKAKDSSAKYYQKKGFKESSGKVSRSFSFTIRL